MREIKFRAWHRREEKMIDVRDLSWFVSSGCTKLKPSSGTFERHVKDEDGKYSHTDEYADIFAEEFELTQFTGLKDKNGKEIYEGDIVNIKYDDSEDDWIGNGNAIVEYGKWDDGDCEQGFGFYYKSICDNMSNINIDGEGNECKVIGNIYANPELLTHKAKSKSGEKSE